MKDPRADGHGTVCVCVIHGWVWIVQLGHDHHTHDYARLR